MAHAPASSSSSPPANRLAREASAYLRTAAHQPVDWYPWGAEAFAKAKAENKPILLDVGAVWCHWCHVMDHESYENPETARIINELYVPVKVDRDERPDVDARYQKAVAALTGQGGWPLTAFLTPEGEPFFGGTYFPPDNRYGRPGFPFVLRSIAGFYQEQPEKVRHQADHLREALTQHGRRNAPGEVGEATLQQGLTSLLGEFDAENGGFGGAPKFPHPGAHAFLLARVRRTRDPAVWNALDVTLTQMGNGGIYDQVGGGFHRYSVDAHWVVPHFEKMLYDNGELLKNYVHAHQATGREDFLAKARDIAQWMEEVLVVPGGGFGASQDADVGPHDDGDYFTWTQAEARAVLDDEEFHLATLHWDIEQRGEMHHNPAKNVLFVAAPAEALSEALSMPLPKVRETLASARRKLRAARAARTAPYVDPTLYANWNGMAITGFLDLAGATGEARYRDVALAALDRFLQTAYAPDRGFAHQVSGDRANVWGLLDDNVQLSDALLTAFNHTQDARHLETAATVGNLLLDRFFDAERGALRDTARGLHATDGVPVLEAAEHPAFDQPTPAPNAVAVLVFDRLARLTGDARYRDAGDRILKGFATDAGQHGVFAGTLLYAMELQANPAPDVLILGPVSDARTQALHAAALAAHAPNATVRRVDPRAPPANLPEEARARLQAVRAGEVAALVCEGFQCSAPLADPKALRERLTRPGSTA